MKPCLPHEVIAALPEHGPLPTFPSGLNARVVLDSSTHSTPPITWRTNRGSWGGSQKKPVNLFVDIAVGTTTKTHGHLPGLARVAERGVETATGGLARVAACAVLLEPRCMGGTCGVQSSSVHNHRDGRSTVAERVTDRLGEVVRGRTCAHQGLIMSIS